MSHLCDDELFVDYYNDSSVEYGFVGYADYELDAEDIDRLIDEERRKHFEELRDIKRDKKGRLNKGARLAQKDCCDKEEIIRLFSKGLTAKAIANRMGCGLASVYRIIGGVKKK